MANRDNTDGTSAHGELLRDIGASRFRALDDDADAKELMRLAVDPLALHSFLQRHQGGKGVTPLETRMVVPGLVLVHSSAQTRGESVYGAPETRLQTSKVLEAFRPSAEDCEHALTIWPEPGLGRAHTPRHSGGMIVYVLVASLVLSVLMFC